MKFYNLILAFGVSYISAFSLLSNDVTHQITRRGYGPIAVECKFESRLKAATTESGFNEIMNDCNNAYNTLLARDSSQQNAIALQAEIVYIKEQFSKYKNDYFLSHPPGGPSTSNPPVTSTTTTNPPVTSTTATSTTKPPVTSTTTSSSTPIPTIPPGQTIFQRCDIENKIKLVKKREEFDVILSSCSTSYNELLNNDPSRINELNSEWLRVQNRIKVAQEDFAREHPDTGNPGGNPGGSTQIATLVKVDSRLAAARSYADFDNLINDCNIAFVQLNTDSSKTVKLQQELEYLKAKIVDAKSKFKP